VDGGARARRQGAAHLSGSRSASVSKAARSSSLPRFPGAYARPQGEERPRARCSVRRADALQEHRPGPLHGGVHSFRSGSQGVGEQGRPRRHLHRPSNARAPVRTRPQRGDRRPLRCSSSRTRCETLTRRHTTRCRSRIGRVTSTATTMLYCPRVICEETAPST
jgi:hypothetical protein